MMTGFNCKVVSVKVTLYRMEITIKVELCYVAPIVLRCGV